MKQQYYNQHSVLEVLLLRVNILQKIPNIAPHPLESGIFLPPQPSERDQYLLFRYTFSERSVFVASNVAHI